MGRPNLRDCTCYSKSDPLKYILRGTSYFQPFNLILSHTEGDIVIYLT